MWRRTLVLGALALSVSCPPSFATERVEPVSVKLVGPIPVAERGRALRATFEFKADTAAEVTDFAVEGSGWSGRMVDRAVGRFAVVPGGTPRFEIEATPADPDQPLVVSWKVAGRSYRRAYDFSPAAAKLRREGGTCVPAPPGARPPRGSRPLDPGAAPGPVGLKFSGPIGTVDPELSREGPAAPANPQVSRWIRVTGFFVYQHQGLSGWPWLGADNVTVCVYEQDFGGSGTDIELARGVTDANGDFDIQVPWADGIEPNPDLYLLIVSANSAMHIQTESGLLYWWRTGTTWDITGTTFAVGGLRPNAESSFPVVHILSDMVRFYRWYLTRLGAAVPYVGLLYPSSNDVSYHSRADEQIGITPGAAWDEGTHGHEFGHHWAHNYLPYFPPDYCNGVCDRDLGNDECGHCEWCWETNTPTTPWFEALPSWLALVQCNDFLADYGWEPSMPGSFEGISTCWDPFNAANRGLGPDANYVEGMNASMLTDLYDSSDEKDIYSFTGGKDTLALGWQPVLNTILARQVFSLSQFVDWFKYDYPLLTERFWRTAANNRYDFDTAMPSPPGGFYCSSHEAGVPSGDATPTFRWTRATDDASGVAGYSISIGAHGSLPDATMECGDVTNWTSPPVAPGTYWVTIRSVDRSGKWGTGFAVWGQLVIREATPANLTPHALALWAYALVPSDRNDNTYLNVAAPTAPLPGNSAATYWNAAIMNVGESSTDQNWLLRTWLDGEPGSWVACPPLVANGVKMAINQGPITVRGGRHTFSLHADDDEEVSETVETDNAWAKQWIWTPATVASGAGVTRTAPPDRIGGWGDLETANYFNCDGLRVTNGAGGNWRALWMRVDDPLVDYDLRLHSVATGADDGFAANVAYSRRPEGCLDAVLYNNLNTPTVSQWDAGVLNSSGGSVNYYAKLVTASPVHEGDSVSISFPAGEMLRLRQFDLAAPDTGWYWAKLSIVSGSGPVYLAWYDEGGDHVALADETYLDTAINSRMAATLELHLGRAGSYALAMYRDPKDGAEALTVRLEFEKVKPDYEPKLLAGWHSPLVPRPASDGTPTSVPMPDTLYGDVASTYLNFVVGNSSHGDQASNVHNHLCLDGVSTWGANILPPNPLDERTYNGEMARSVRGGRHVLSLRINPDGTIAETDVEDNGWGEQWVFGPATMAATLTRDAPPEMTGGWDEVTNAPGGLWYNCDGLRVGGWYESGHDQYWGGFAVMPGDTSDLDVRLHEVVPGTRSGFRSTLIRSTAGPGQLDYVLVNFNRTAFRKLDLGVLRVDGAQGYTAQAARSVYRGSLPDGYYGPYTMPAGTMLHLHEFFMDTGVWDVKLVNGAGTVNWGLSAHAGAEAYHNLSTVMEGGIDWLGGPGVGENMRIRVNAPNYQAIAVWKAGSADQPLAGTYTLEVRRSPVDVPEAAVARTAFATAWPNPFGAGATLAFELARECDVSLEVYDLHGARVRTLASGTWPAGRHEVRWDGGGDGRPVAPGIYFVRFEADGVASARRLVKIE